MIRRELEDKDIEIKDGFIFNEPTVENDHVLD